MQEKEVSRPELREQAHCVPRFLQCCKVTDITIGHAQSWILPENSHTRLPILERNSFHTPPHDCLIAWHMAVFSAVRSRKPGGGSLFHGLEGKKEETRKERVGEISFFGNFNMDHCILFSLNCGRGGNCPRMPAILLLNQGGSNRTPDP